MKRQYLPTHLSIRRQQGAVLIVGLIFLLILTIIGTTSISDTDLQERMAGNLRDRNSAFQSAEAALRTAEYFLDNNDSVRFDGSKIGYWPDLNVASNVKALKVSGHSKLTRNPGYWSDQQWTSFSLKVADGTIQNVSKQPRYTIELMNVSELAATQGSGVDVESREKFANAEYYRITAQGYGISGNSTVTVQSTYLP
jgi:type IV pilus assembly protein PilX